MMKTMIRAAELEDTLGGGTNYDYTIRHGEIKQYVRDGAGRIIESVSGVKKETISLEVGWKKYEIPTGADILNVDDRIYGWNDRAILFYVLWANSISQKYLWSKTHTQALLEEWLRSFSTFLQTELESEADDRAPKNTFDTLQNFQILD